jgi:hypothetical protein
MPKTLSKMQWKQYPFFSNLWHIWFRATKTSTMRPIVSQNSIFANEK